VKNLIYKELKLSMHPVCWCFIFLFPLMVFIPGYPVAISYIYVMAAYPILFLGANKGQQSNDLLYSTLLPVRKKDIVLARIITVMIMQLIVSILVVALSPLAKYVLSLPALQNAAKVPGLSHSDIGTVVAFSLLTFGICDFIFFPIYYHKGRSIVASSLLTIFTFAILIVTFTIILPTIPGLSAVLQNNPWWLQIIFVVVALGISCLLHFGIYKVSSRLLEKVDM